MFKFETIKAKILITILVTLFALIVALTLFSAVYFQKSKQIYIDAYYRYIANFIHVINKDICKIEDNARDMAILGEIFYKLSPETSILDKYVVKIVAAYIESVSGGIFFEPYVIKPKQERFSSFAYMDKDNKVVTNNNYQTEEKSYLNSLWYKDLMKQLSTEKKIVWSSPYLEGNGVNNYMVTAGMGIYVKGKLIGVATADWVIDDIIDDLSVLKPTPNSFLVFADIKNDFIIYSSDKYIKEDLFGKSLNNLPWYNKNNNHETFKYHNTTYISYVEKMDNGMLLIINVPEKEMYKRILFRFVGLFSILIPFCIILCCLLYFSLQNNIVKPIIKLMTLADAIKKGKSDITIKIDKPFEFAELAQTFDEMLQNIKKITKKQAKMDSELSIAKSIQAASMPNTFPAYPDKTDFDIFATMTPAKEVGGDFYDFYFIDKNHLMFLIGDVSGKGIPAALFMMKVKTLINNTYQNQDFRTKLIEIVNKKICEGNKEGLFVTLFLCIVNVTTGEAKYVNCGHNPPLIKRHNGSYEYLDVPTNIVLGVFENVEYNICKTKLKSGDKLFLYTDGITEAYNDKNEMYGEKRLQETLNNCLDLSLNDTLNNITTSIDEFKNSAKQSDDITMLIFEYKGNSNIKIFKDIALKENYKDFYPILYDAVEEWQIDKNTADKLYMCAEELYANVAFHAYPQEAGIIEVILSKNNNDISLTFKDHGIEYNPLNKQDPDITLTPEKRPLGGLGIFMIKKMADNIIYERTDNQNILTITFLYK